MAKTATKSKSKQRTSTKSMKKSSAGRKSSPARSRRKATKSATKPAASAGDKEVTICRRRGERRDSGAKSEDAGTDATPKLQRREKVNRRRQIDPTTCERDYTEHEIEFMNALDAYKRKSGRMFPTCSEVLEVIRSLGYVKLSASELLSMPGAGADQPAASARPMPTDWQPTAPGLMLAGRV